MKEAVLILGWILFYFCLVSLIAGLIRPVLVLWFLDRMNRLKVLKIYGIISLILLAFLLLTEYYFN
ncbi:hypothetical protein SAMN04489724_3419 [Algoriphagus locisalis]|uniref:Uncharacterized protein n=1 Tax=Algoriphagus locisalis TaxID=305507 RepID=A0A1I7CTM9_9BACT|nr:hypothetical protein SAMN04489724_3419 [Algoriphagus locisalis]